MRKYLNLWHVKTSVYWGNSYNEGTKRVHVIGEMAVVRVKKDIKLLGEKSEIARVKVRKEVRLLG